MMQYREGQAKKNLGDGSEIKPATVAEATPAKSFSSGVPTDQEIHRDAKGLRKGSPRHSSVLENA
jgi:hypothetical protein